MLKNVLLQYSGTGLSYEALDHKQIATHIYTEFKKIIQLCGESINTLSENFVARCSESAKAYPAFL